MINYSRNECDIIHIVHFSMQYYSTVLYDRISELVKCYKNERDPQYTIEIIVFHLRNS